MVVELLLHESDTPKCWADRGKNRVSCADDFARAAELLRARGLITATAEDRFVTLAEGRTTAEIAQALVATGLPVAGLWQQEQTVEDFYLNLIKPPSGAAGK